MSKDVRLKDDDKEFKLRVAGIVENNGKVLVVQMNNNNFYCFPGGHAEIYEDSKTALERELKEELYFDVEIDNLVVINENFYFLREKHFHEVCFYYFAHPKDKNLDMTEKTIIEQDKFGEVKHKYVWLDKNSLLDFKVRPNKVVEHVMENKSLLHILTKE